MENILSALEKNMYSVSLRWSVLHVSTGFSWSIVSNISKSSVSLLIFCLIALPTTERGLYWNLLLLCYDFFLHSVHVSFLYLGALLLSAYIFIIVISSWGIDFYHCIISFFVSCDRFLPKVYFIWCKCGHPGLFCLPFAWSIFSLLSLAAVYPYSKG